MNASETLTPEFQITHFHSIKLKSITWTGTRKTNSEIETKWLYSPSLALCLPSTFVAAPRPKNRASSTLINGVNLSVNLQPVIVTDNWWWKVTYGGINLINDEGERRECGGYGGGRWRGSVLVRVLRRKETKKKMMIEDDDWNLGRRDSREMCVRLAYYYLYMIYVFSILFFYFLARKGCQLIPLTLHSLR